MPKVSIIVPVYNVEAYLRDCLDTLICQTLRDIEIICVNDGSTDSSPEILREYSRKDSRIRIVDQANGGYGKAMNAGLEIAAGEYMGIAEPDDLLELNMFETLYEAAAANDLDIVKSDYYRLQTEGKPANVYLVYHPLDAHHEFYNRLIDPRQEPRITRTNVHTWCGLYKTDFLRRHNIVHHETPGASLQDVGFFWRSLMHARRMMLIDRAFYKYRVDNPGSSNYDPSKVYAVVNEYSYIEKLFHEDEMETGWEVFCTHFHYKKFLQFRYNIRRTAHEVRSEYIERFAEEFKRIREKGELDRTLFSETDAGDLDLLLKDPAEYLAGFSLPDLKPPRTPSQLKKDNRTLREKNNALKSSLAKEKRKVREAEKRCRSAQKRVLELEDSTTYKAGRAVMYVPVTVKKAVKKKQQSNA